MSSVGFLSWHERLQVYRIALDPPFESYYISPLLSGDAPALVGIFGHERMRDKLYRQPIPYTEAYAQTLIDRNAHLEEFYETVRTTKPDQQLPRIPDHFFGCLRDGHDRVVATMDLCARDIRPDKRFIGFFLHPDLQGKGIISAAAKRMMEALDAHNGRELIYGIATENNPGSQRILQKLGFVEQERFDVQYPPDKGSVIKRVVEYARLP